MRGNILFNPKDLRNPRQVRAFRRFENALESIREAKNTVLEADNKYKVDQNSTPGTVVVDRYWADNDEAFRGTVSPDLVDLESTRGVSDEFEDSFTTSRYHEQGNEISLFKEVRREIPQGRYHSSESHSWTHERFIMNLDGTVRFLENSSRQHRNLGEW